MHLTLEDLDEVLAMIDPVQIPAREQHVTGQDGCYIEGSLMHDHGHSEVHIDHVAVPSDLADSDVVARLILGFADLGRYYRAETLRQHVESADRRCCVIYLEQNKSRSGVMTTCRSR